MNRIKGNLLAALGCLVLVAASAAQAGEVIPLEAFGDGIQHWKNVQGDSYPVYKAEQVREIADNLLLHQRANGGWASNFDPLRIVTGGERRELERLKTDFKGTTLDNRSTYPEVEYLAAAYRGTKDARYRDAAVRGLEFILEAQYENGGWPHSYPRKDGYRPHITIVDDVMAGVLRSLRTINTGKPPFDFLEPPLRERVANALDRGDACLLKLQVRVDGKLTGWASQYDEVTLTPTGGRSFELPALIGSESAFVLRYLMSIDNPSPATREAIRAGVAWLERSQVRGLRIERVPAATIRYANHTSNTDKVTVEDASAPPLWARFYEVDTNRPFMANRDGKKVYRLSEVDRERRTGYSWYSSAPRDLLEREYPAWEKKWGKS